MIVEVYDALRDAGASEEKAQSAAKAIADYDSRFNKIEADMRIVKWMLGAVLAGVVSLILKSFF